jgi:hypothetical protein
MVIGFIFWWPVGLAVFVYLVWSNKLGGSWKPWTLPFWSSGNSAFDDHRDKVLSDLRQEQDDFAAFIKQKLSAKDQAEFKEFVAKRKQKTGRHYRNIYYIQESAYKEVLFSGKAQRRQGKLGICAGCTKFVSISEVGKWGDTDDYCHFGCGGRIQKFRRAKKSMVD